MATLKKYDFTGKDIGEENFDDDLLKKEANQQMIKDYIVAIRKNARQWSANTKGRSEVNRVKQKSQQQKGLGRARHGFLSAPQFKGGGVAFGPKPKFDQHIKVNKKEKKLAIQSLIADKIKENRASILEVESLDSPKTKAAFEFFKNLQMMDKRVLVIGKNDPIFSNLFKSIRNIPKKHCSEVSQVNGYELALCQDVVILSSALGEIKDFLLNKAGE